MGDAQEESVPTRHAPHWTSSPPGCCGPPSPRGGSPTRPTRAAGEGAGAHWLLPGPGLPAHLPSSGAGLGNGCLGTQGSGTSRLTSKGGGCPQHSAGGAVGELGELPAPHQPALPND